MVQFTSLLFLCGGVTAQDLFLGQVAEPQYARPNILWVMSDDLGWGEPGLYPSTSEHGRIATPHLDKFGKEGLVFTHAYAGYTVCAPSRTTFFTGRHSGQFVKHGLNGEQLSPGQANATTIASVLQKAGYTTGAFGKTAPLDSPLKQGFDAFLGQIDQADCHNMYPIQIDEGTGRNNVNLTLNWKKKNRELCMAHPQHYNYTIDAFQDAGMAWLEKAARGPKPFFLYMSFTVPHAGGWGDHPQDPEQGAPVPTDLQYTNSSWPDVERDHAAVITYLDGKFGDIMARLKALGVDKDTLVIFASDNGAHIEGGHKKEFFNSTGGLQGNKRSLFEGGYRSPTMARWPAVITPGRESNFPWAFWDVMPTIAELSGADAPEGLDGISIVPTLKDEKQPAHKYLFWTWLGNGGHGYSVRVGDLKGMVQACNPHTLKPSLDDEMALFDVVNDPFETTDIASKHPDVVARFKRIVVSEELTCQCYQCR